MAEAVDIVDSVAMRDADCHREKSPADALLVFMEHRAADFSRGHGPGLANGDARQNPRES